MKKTATTVGKIIRNCLAGAVSLLGFTACDEINGNGNMICMYGTPGGRFEVKGNVTGPDNKPADADVILRHLHPDANNDISYTAFSDTVGTDSEGRYKINNVNAPFPKFRVVCHPKDATLEPDSVELESNFSDGTSTWDQGTVRETIDFHLKHKGEEPDK